MTDIAVVILTKNLNLHIKRCLGKLIPLAAKQIFVIDPYGGLGRGSLVQ